MIRRAVATVVLLLGAAAGFAQDSPPAPATYIRSREEVDGTVLLELATRAFSHPDGRGPRIHLVSALHIADAPFYAGMQERLARFDLVLYEGVKPAGTGATAASASPEKRAKTTRTRLDLLRALARRQRERSGAYPEDLARLAAGAGRDWAAILQGVLVDGWGRPIRYARRAAAGSPEAASFASDGPDGKEGSEDDLRVEALATDPAPARVETGIQSDMARALGLVFQGDAMDESGPAWRSSDMSVDELQERFDAAGADATELMALLDGTSFTARVAKGILAIVGMSRSMATMVKLSLVEALASDDEGMGGADRNLRALMKVVIEDRNAVVIGDLRGVIAKEPGVREAAVLYGAGHMADMERRLVAELGYRPGETTWAVAIRVEPRDAGFASGMLRTLREAARKAAEKKAKENR